jgi:hypothetical protein
MAVRGTVRLSMVPPGDELAHGVGVDQVVEETAAGLTDGRILVMEASRDGADRVCATPQQFVISRDGALWVTRARDEGLAVGSGESEHDPRFKACGESRQEDF